MSYQQAVIMVTNSALEDHARISELDDPNAGKQVRLATETKYREPYVNRMFEGSKALTEDHHAFSYALYEDGDEVTLDLKTFDPLEEAKEAINGIYADLLLDNPERFVRYQNVLKVCSSEHAELSDDLDDRDDFELVRRKLERRIADLAGDPNTTTAVAERYYLHNQIRAGVLRKHHGSIKRLTDHLGDVPSHTSCQSLYDGSGTNRLPSEAIIFSSRFHPYRPPVDRCRTDVDGMDRADIWASMSRCLIVRPKALVSHQ